MTPYYDEDGITIYHADCMDVIPHLDRDSLAAIVTDPPYGMNYTQSLRNGDNGWNSRWAGTQIVGDADTSMRDSVLEWWGNRPALVFGTWKTSLPRGVRDVLIWDKVVSTGMGDLSIPWRPSHEQIHVIGSGFTGRRKHGVLRYSLPTLAPERKWHPTPKPVSIMYELVGACPEGPILDPFMGSGPIAEACLKLGRRYIGIEIVEEYCEIAVRRFAQGVLEFGRTSE